MADNPLKDYSDLVAAAKQLGIHHETVRHLIRQSALPAIKVSGKWYIHNDDITLLKTWYKPRAGRSYKSMEEGYSPRNKPIMIRLTEEEHYQLHKVSNTSGISMSKLIRNALKEVHGIEGGQ